MNIRFHNTLTRRVEAFEPIEPPGVSMYSCGLTVYDYGHIGNFRTFMFYDLLRRFLEMAGYRVKQVMNITDVGHMTEDQLADGGGEDKMQVAASRIKEAKKEGRLPPDAVADPDDPYEVARFYIEAFLKDAAHLGLRIADEFPQRVPRATDHVPQMQAMIQTLLDKGHAYVAADGAVYYHVKSFPEYGRLSGNTVEQMQGGAGGRVLAEHQAVKRDPSDFLLWKPDASHIMKWDSPWGAGYPGWHIECSAMATAVLGRDVIDIHTGGEDNIFPHHECEIAQTCAATGRSEFARFWMHSRFLLVDGEKMSKSKGTVYTLREIVEGQVTGRPVSPTAVRFELLRTHYRSNLNFTAKSLEDAARAVQRLREAAGTADDAEAAAPDHPVVRDFAAALADDLNISAALAVIFTWLNRAKPPSSEAGAVLRRVDTVLGVLSDRGAGNGGPASGSGRRSDADARDVCRRIDAARGGKDFAEADRLRQELIDAGFDVKTAREGTVANRRLA